LHVGGILFVAQLVGQLLDLSLGRDFAIVPLLFAPVFGALLWPVVHWIATLPRFRRRTDRTVML